MQATAAEVVTTTTSGDMTHGSQSDEPLIRDVTMEVLGERRAEWREGYDAGLMVGGRRVLESNCVVQLVAELMLLREVAAKLGEKCDYWIRKSDEFEAEAAYWHEVSSRSSVRRVIVDPSFCREIPGGRLDQA